MKNRRHDLLLARVATAGVLILALVGCRQIADALTPHAPPIIDHFVLISPTMRPEAPQPVVTPKVVQRATPKPIGAPRTSHSVRGVATWYCQPGVSRCTSGYPSTGAYAAAGPALRAALGHWRGKVVWVNGIRVTLVDWCACSGAHVIDVYHSTWLRIPHPNSATIRW